MSTLASITTRPHFLSQRFVLSQLQTKADAISPAADSTDKRHNHEHMCRNKAGCAHWRVESSPRTDFILCSWTRSALKLDITADLSVGYMRETHLQIVAVLLLPSLMTPGSFRPLCFVLRCIFPQYYLWDLHCVCIKGFALKVPRWYLTDRWFCTFYNSSASILWLLLSKSLSQLLPLWPRMTLTAPVIFQQALNISDSRFSRVARKSLHLKSQPCGSLSRFRAVISCV